MPQGAEMRAKGVLNDVCMMQSNKKKREREREERGEIL
jgi:hypothetical protein